MSLSVVSMLLGPDAPARLLVEAPLKPMQGQRFQPTGFPDLGAARFDTEDGGSHLLVESAQSMANRMEAVCWDEVAQAPVGALAGVSYVRVEKEGRFLTSSLIEPHRLNSPYIVTSSKKGAGAGGGLLDELKGALGHDDKALVDRRQLVKVLFGYDLGTLLHGVFLEKIAGRLRIERALSAFVEADGVRVAASGGVKFDQVNPSGSAKDGFGHVPFQRDEYTAGAITAFFNLDLAQIRAYGLDADATELLVVLALYKIQAVLARGLRLRTACDLEVARDVQVTRPAGLVLPTLAALEAELPGLIARCAAQFVAPGGVKTVAFEG